MPTGQVGFELVRTLQPLAPVIATTRASLDVTDPRAVRAFIRDKRPRAVINAAGYTAVDDAEANRADAMRVNGDAPGVLAAAAAEANAVFVHYSSDYVYDGTAASPYTEDALTDPVNVYGESKLAGDRAVTASGAAAIILRTCWVYGRRGRNFLRTMQRLGAERPELRVVDDQTGCPTSARYIAQATARILGVTDCDPARVRGVQGVYHLAAGGSTSWCGFARAIMRGTAGLEHVDVAAIPTSAFPTPAKRPAYSVLDTRRIRDAFGIHVPDWQTLLALELEP